MQKFLRTLAFVALMAVPWVVNAQNTLTVADGTVTNVYVPVYGYYGDAYLHCQYIYPASDIALATTTVGMNGGSITSMTFYTTEASVSLSATFTFKLMEMSYTTLDAYQDVTGATLVYTGSVAVANNQMTVTFDNPYTYNGGNLLVDLTTVSTGNYSQTTYYGVSASGASVSGYSYSSVSAASIAQRNFIPKTTFTFTGGTAVTCPPIQGITFGAIDSNSAVITWVDNLNSGANYTVTYWPQNAGADDTLNETSNTTSITLTDLDANTRYYFTIEVNCSASDNSVALGSNFRTTCGVTTLPFFVDFEDVAYNGAWYPCWDSVIHAGTDPSVNNVRNHTTGGTYSIYLQNSTTESYNLVVGPVMDADGDNIYCRFWAYLQGGWIKAGVITNIHDTSTFIPLVTVNGSGWNEYEFNTATLDPTANYRIAWLGYRATSYYPLQIGSIDDITVSEIPSCIRVTNVTLDSAASDELTLSWVDNANTGASYTVNYWKNGTTDTLTETSNTTSVTLTGLDASTLYNLFVTPNCSSGDAEPSPVFSFRTACGEVTLPYFTDFEDIAYNGAAYPCWDTTIYAGTDPSVNYADDGSSDSHPGQYSYYLQGSSSQNYNLLVGPAMNATGNDIYVRFEAKCSSGWIKAGVLTDPHDTSTFIPMVQVSGNSWAEYEFNTANLSASANYRVAWLAYGSGYIGKVDNVYISEIPSCLRVASVAADSISEETIILTWVDGVNSGATYTVVCCGPVDTVEYSNITETFFVFDNLSANTPYTFSVTVNCGSDDAEAVSATFRTACGATPIPFVEGFEDAGALSCWQVVNPVSNTGRKTEGAHTGNACFLFYYTTNPPEYLISPELTNTDNGLKVEFYYKNYSDYYGESFKVGYSTTADSLGAFIWGNEVQNNSTNYQLYSEILPAGTKYMAIQYTANDALGLYIDDINFLEPPTCMPVSLLGVDTITSDGATIYWTAPNGQSDFIVRLDSVDYNVQDTFYTFTGLNARTAYTAQVASDCGDTSSWMSIDFTTDCAGGSCDITVAMTDQYSDSWNGAKLYFTQNGTFAGYVTLEYGLASGTATVNVCAGNPVTYNWQSGSYDDEISYIIYDGGGAEVYNSATSGVNHSGTIADACPTCLTPACLTVTFLDSNSITVTWTDNASVDHYLVSFNGGAYGNPNNGTNSHSEVGLNPNTAYTFNVIAVCDPGVDTSFPGTLTVKTSCGTMALPFVEGFENDNSGSVPSCWNLVAGTPAVQASANYAHTGTNFLYLAGGDMIATSLVPLAGDSIYVSFWADNYSGTLEAGVMTDILAANTFVALDTIYNTSGYELFEFNTASLNPYVNYYVAFRFTSAYSSVSIDDINIRRNEGCMYPANLTATPAANDVTLTWVNNSVNSDFVVQYHADGVNTWDTTIDVTGTTYTVTGLNAATNYLFRVGYLCNNDTLWSSITAQTTCDLLPVPYFENFYSATGELPPCWEYDSQIGWNNWPLTSGNGELMFKANSGGHPAVLPQFAATFTKLQITFATKCRPDNEGEGIMIGVADAAGNLIAWIDTLYHPNHSQATFVEHTYNFLNYYGPGERIALGHKLNTSNGNHWCSIDSITVIALQDCYPVDSLQAYNLIDPDHTSFSWLPQGYESQWQVYVDTVTVDIETVPDSLFTIVNTPSYEIPMGTVQGGGIYNFYVRAYCGSDQSIWVNYEFGAGTVIMNNSSTADTVLGCGLVVYDNGGPVAGYADYSNSALVIRAENAGNELQIFGGKFGWSDDPITLTVYDGEGTNGTVLYQKNNTGIIEYTIDSILATSTTGALTITFVCNGNRVHTGYELYIHCVGTALCERPTQLNAVMTGVGEAQVTWAGTADSYDLQYKLADATTWTVQSGIIGTSTTLTGLQPDTLYNLQVVGVCGSTTSTPSFPAELNTHYDVVILPCDPVTNVTVSNVTTTTATLAWTSTADTWEVELSNVSGSTTFTTITNPHALTGLLPDMDYRVRVRANCNGQNYEPTSAWSAAVPFHTDTVAQQGIDDVDALSSVVLYPNPATTTVTLDLAGVEDAISVCIIDLNGRQVYTAQATDERMTIDVSALVKGAYFVRVTGSNTTAVRKLIVK